MRSKDYRRRTAWCNDCGRHLRPGHGERCVRWHARQARRRRLQYPLALLGIVLFAVVMGGLAQ